MRVAANEPALESAFSQARQEAEAAFGNPDVYMEKYVENPRHVEVQIIADHHATPCTCGNVIARRSAVIRKSSKKARRRF